MSSFKPTQTPDSFIISKAFEKGAAFATTREATIALGGKTLDTARIHSNTVKNSLKSDIASGVTDTGKESTDPTLSKNFANKKETDKSFLQDLKSNFIEGQVQGNKNKTINADILGGIFNTECIPCGDRLNLAGDLDFKKGMQDWFKRWMEALNEHLRKILELLDFIDPAEPYIDLCPLFSFFENFVCVPDLARLISMLMSEMSRISIDFTSVLDLIVGALSPVLTPILDALVKVIIQYIAVIIAPIRCILKALESMLTKLDYNEIFGGAPNFDIGVKIGLPNDPNTGKPSGLAQDVASVALAAGLSKNLSTAKLRERELKGNPTRTLVDKKRASDLKIKKAKESFNKIAKRKVDKTNSIEVERHQADLDAQEKAIASAENDARSSVGKVKEQIKKLKSILDKIVNIITNFIRYWNNWLQTHLEEFKKWMQGYFGAAGSLSKFMAEKLELLQLIALFKAIMNLNLECKEKDKGKGNITSVLPLRRGFTALEDDQGNVTISRSPILKEAVTPILNELSGIGTGSPTQVNGFVVNQTGDDILDQNVARIVSNLTNVEDVTFDCSVRVSSPQTQKVNSWIKELGFV